MILEQKLEIAAELANLRAIRDFVRQEAAALGAGPDAISDMLLSVNEHVTNVIIHGYRGQAGKIEITVSRNSDDLVIQLRDGAPAFDPHTVPQPDLTLPVEERPFGGMGVYMMMQLMDRVIHAVPPQGGNELTLIKKITEQLEGETQ